MKNTTTKPRQPETRAPKTPPRFKSEAEEARWWASKEGRAYSLRKFQQSAKTEKLRRGTPPNVLQALATAGKTVPISLRLSAADLLKAQKLADQKGVGYQTIIKMLLHEKLAEQNN
jgi:predicted DNA binding CopG/RHH family protein